MLNLKDLVNFILFVDFIPLFIPYFRFTKFQKFSKSALVQPKTQNSKPKTLLYARAAPPTCAFAFIALFLLPLTTSFAQNVTKLNPDFTKEVFLFRDQVSPDGQHIVFISDRETKGVRELFSVPIDGGEPIKLNPDFPDTNRDVVDFRISKDFNFVVYRADQDTDDVFELYSTSITGGFAAKISGDFPDNNRDVDLDYQISPSNFRVVYRADQEVDEVFEIFSASIFPDTLFNANVKLNPDFPDDDRDVRQFGFRICPNSQRVLYNADQETDEVRELFSVPLFGGPAVKLNPEFTGDQFEINIGSERISPDGANVAFQIRSPNNQLDLFSVPISGGAAVQLNPVFTENNRSVQSRFQFTPDGSRIVYLSDQETNDVLEIFSVPTTGGASIKLNPDFPDNNRDVDFFSIRISPNSDRVLYLADQDIDQVFELFSAPLDQAGAAIKLNPDLSGNRDVTSSGLTIDPTGTLVAYLADQETNDVDELFVTALNGSFAPFKINPDFPDNNRDVASNGIQFSSDGSKLTYVSDERIDGLDELYVVTLSETLGDFSTIKLNPDVSDTGQDILGGTVQFTPDGSHVGYKQRLGFNEEEDEDFNGLFTVAATGGMVNRINEDVFRDVSDRELSPDGSHVVYIANQKNENRRDLFSVPIGGGTPVKLNPNNTEVFFAFLTFSPDGSRVIFRAENVNDEINALYSVPIGGGTAIQLNPDFADDARRFFGFEVSPDGSHVVYRADQDINDAIELFSVPIDGGTAVKLHPDLPSNRDVGSIKITPDGSRVVFRADIDAFGRDELYSVPITGGTLTRLDANFPTGGDVLSQFELSPDGSQVLYICDCELNLAFELFIIPVTGGTPLKLNPDFTDRDQDVRSGTPQFSPDGSRVIYAADVTDRIFELFSVAATGGTVTKLHPDITEFARDVDPFTAQISPDGSRVIFLANLAETAAAELYSVPIAGGTLTKLNPSFADNSREVQDFGIRISPNSSHVVYTADQETDDVFELFSVPLTGGTSVKLNPTLAANRSLNGGLVQISPNGEQVIYISD
ncbi:MAG: hypothetical protein AB8G22_01075, partial [Saprospiraceae bacterium]